MSCHVMSRPVGSGQIVSGQAGLGWVALGHVMYIDRNRLIVTQHCIRTGKHCCIVKFHT